MQKKATMSRVKQIFIFILLFLSLFSANLVAEGNSKDDKSEETTSASKPIILVADKYFEKPLNDCASFYSSSFKTDVKSFFVDEQDINQEIQNHKSSVVIARNDIVKTSFFKKKTKEFHIAEEMVLVATKRIPSKLNANKVLMLNGVKKIFYLSKYNSRSDLELMFSKVVMDPKRLTSTLKKTKSVDSVQRALTEVETSGDALLLIPRSQLMSYLPKPKLNIQNFEPQLIKQYTTYSIGKADNNHFISFLEGRAGRKFFKNRGFVVNG